MRAALTQTVNAYPDMPGAASALGRLAGRLPLVREANLRHHEALLRAAAAQGVQAVCLGELFPAPYFALGKDPLWFGLAEDAETGPSVSAMRALAAELRLVIVAPIYELEASSGRRFNTAVVIEQDGRVLGRYRKVHIPCGANEQGSFHETFYYERSGGEGPGGYLPVFSTSAGRIGVAICYDRHFEGVARGLARAGAELIFSPAVTFGAKSRRLWDLEFLVDACRHRVFIGGSNRLGSEKPWGQEYFGRSYFAGPDGAKLADLSQHPNLIVADLDLAALERPDPSGWDLPRDARPDVYPPR
ncbi:MAG: acyltransferase [Elusimicrobia bacterium]|nr:acyltransferase [Elusimicrobiota bacterium]